jgi:hypothetical protein
MIFVRTAADGANAFGQLKGRKSAVRLNDPPLAMHPHRFNRVKPRAFDGQATDQDAHSLAAVPHLTIMLPDPSTHLFADVPRSIIPNQSQNPFAHVFQLLATPFKELDGVVADGTAIDETQQDFLIALTAFIDPTQQHSITGQRFGVWIVFGLYLFDQAQGTILFSPGRQVGLGKTAPPGLITKTLHPIWIPLAQADQPITGVFLR